MLPETACDADFFAWLDTLSDEEHHAMLLHLRRLAADLRCRIDRKSFTTHKFLDLAPHRPALVSLN